MKEPARRVRANLAAYRTLYFNVVYTRRSWSVLNYVEVTKSVTIREAVRQAAVVADCVRSVRQIHFVAFDDRTLFFFFFF